MQTRPPRRMPSLKRVAAFRGLADEAAHCIRCGWEPPEVKPWSEAGGYIVRAHVIDRVFDGLDGEQNLAPLCNQCHDAQPIFRPGDEGFAVIWFGLWDRIATWFPTSTEPTWSTNPQLYLTRADGLYGARICPTWLSARTDFIDSLRPGSDGVQRRQRAVARMYRIELSYAQAAPEIAEAVAA